MTVSPDRLYELLPMIHRLRDAEQGYPLRGLLRVIGSQVQIVEDNIEQLYDNWFIETCEDWVVPYIADLIGFQPVHEAGEPGALTSPGDSQGEKILITRREAANAIRSRRRKGSLALLELLANDTAGWPAHAVEFFKLLAWTQAVNHLRLDRGGTVDLRDDRALHKLGGPFDAVAHSVEVRSVKGERAPGRYNIPSVGVFVWRLQSFPVTQTPASCHDEKPHYYNFSIAGNDAPLFNRPQPETGAVKTTVELKYPAPIRLQDFKERLTDYYGAGKSLQIWIGEDRKPIPANRIVPADLSGWLYQPRRNQVAVDPETGRIAFPPGHAPGEQTVWVSYCYGFSAKMGGGEYERRLTHPVEFTLYRVGSEENFHSIGGAYQAWRQAQEERPEVEALHHAVIEIADNGLYEESLSIELDSGRSLQIRAADGKRPVIVVRDLRRSQPDALLIRGKAHSKFMLDGVLVVGGAVQLGDEAPDYGDGAAPSAETGFADVVIRHSTLTPGWSLTCDCEPRRAAQPSLRVIDARVRVSIEHSIMGSIEIIGDESRADPSCVNISDSIVDATDCEREALGAPGCPLAYAVLTIKRSTVLGEVKVHAIELAENTIFQGKVWVARRQIGCMRFCYAPPMSRTPRRYHCQPELAEQTSEERALDEASRAKPKMSRAEAATEVAAARQSARERVRPQFNSVRFGKPEYCQLAFDCPEEIRKGADDESEMGAFHDLRQPQREANLRLRLDEYTPAGMEAGIIFVN